VPRGSGDPIGLIHVRALGPGFGTADWGAAIASEFWGKGIFTEAAELVLDFAFEVLRTHRLEARAAICNGRGNGAMRKLGAEREGVLRHSFFRNGDYLDQVVWSILKEDWRKRRQETIHLGLERHPLTSALLIALAARAFARAAHSSRSRGSAAVTSESIRRRAIVATSSTPDRRRARLPSTAW